MEFGIIVLVCGRLGGLRFWDGVWLNWERWVVVVVEYVEDYEVSYGDYVDDEWDGLWVNYFWVDFFWDVGKGMRLWFVCDSLFFWIFFFDGEYSCFVEYNFFLLWCWVCFE